MHPATERFPAGREGVARLFDELAGVPAERLLFLARSYRPAEQGARDAAWERVLEEAEFRHRDDALDEIREAAIGLVTVRHSAVDARYAVAPLAGLVDPAAVDRPQAQVQVVNAMVEAAGAILVADLVEDEVVAVLAGPVLDLLDAVAEERADAGRHRRDAYGLGQG